MECRVFSNWLAKIIMIMIMTTMTRIYQIIHFVYYSVTV